MGIAFGHFDMDICCSPRSRQWSLGQGPRFLLLPQECIKAAEQAERAQANSRAVRQASAGSSGAAPAIAEEDTDSDGGAPLNLQHRVVSRVELYRRGFRARGFVRRQGADTSVSAGQRNSAERLGQLSCGKHCYRAMPLAMQAGACRLQRSRCRRRGEADGVVAAVVAVGVAGAA